MNRKLKTHELKRLSPEEFIAEEKFPLVIVLDNIRSLNNIGSVFRTADAFKIEAVHLCGITAKPPHNEIRKTALGSTETVKWKHFDRTMDSIVALRQNNYKIISIEQTESSIQLQDFQPQKGEKLAVVLGNEVKGVQQEIIDISDLCMEIPQFGTKHSLNISVCSGIVVWDIFQKAIYNTKTGNYT